MILNFNFYKTEENRWFISIPGWEGDVEELEMVAGADQMLDLYANGQTLINLSLSTTPRVAFDKLTMVECVDCPGAYYKFESFNSSFSFELWLCDVVKYIFTKFPDTLYVKKNRS